MASDIVYTRPLPPPPPVGSTQEVDPEELLILRQVETTRRRIATVELSWRILVLVAGTFVFAMISAVFDQWVFAQGMPNLVRWLLWAVFLTASLVWTVVAVLPYLLRRIHPVFAAFVVEQAVPNLKHGLISFLTLRDRKDQLQADPIRKNVFRGLETTTANTIAKVPADAVVDRSQIIRTGYVLVVLIALFCLYIIFSPKDPIRSFARTLFPWSRLSPPTRVKIDDVRPGTTGIIEGEPVVVIANVRGLRAGEEVRVVYSTSDGQAVNQTIPMSRERENDDRFSCELSQSFRQETNYRILAGDAATEEYKLGVIVPLRFRIRNVEYQFPAYTGLPPRVTEDLGDIRAVEGTKIKLTAESDVPLNSAEMVIEKVQTASLPMVVKDRVAFAQTILRLSKSDGREREFGAYFIRGQSIDGRPSVDPVRYTIEIIPDQPPQGTWLEPAQEEISLPVDGTLPLRIRAEDPDFGLRQVGLEIEAGGSRVLKHALLDKPAGESQSGEFVGEFLFVPEDLNLAAGDVAICRVTLVDNREPTPNRTLLPVRRIRITERDGPNGSPSPPPSSQAQQSQTPRSQNGSQSQEERQVPPKAGLQSDPPKEPSPPNTTDPQTEQQTPDSASAQSSKTPEQQPADRPQDSPVNQGEQSQSSSATENGRTEDQSQKNTTDQGQNQQSADPSAGQTKPEQSPSGDMPQGGENQSGTQTQAQGSQTGDPAQTQNGQTQAGERRPAGNDSDSVSAEQTDRENSTRNGQSEGTQQSGDRQDSQSSDSRNGGQASGEQGENNTSGQNGKTENSRKPEESGQPNAPGGDSRNQTGNSPTGQQGGSPGSQGGAAPNSEATAQRPPNLGVKGGGDSSASNPTATNDSSSAPGNSSASGSDPRNNAGSASQGTKPEQTSGQDNGGSGEKVDGVTNPGEAVERILSYLEKKGIDPDQLPRGSNDGEGRLPSAEQTAKNTPQGEQSTRQPSAGPAGNANAGQNSSSQGSDARPGASSETPTGPQAPVSSGQGVGQQRPPQDAPPIGDPPSEGKPNGLSPDSQTSSEPPAAAQPQPSGQTPRQPREGVAGDQAGMGGRGGGQDSQQPGEGTAGSQTPTDSSEGSPIASQGGQETSQSSGQSGPSGQASPSEQSGASSSQGGRTAETGGTSGQNDTPSGGLRSLSQAGNTPRGGMAGGDRGPNGGADAVETRVDDPNLEFARRQTDLVLRYLEEELAKQNPDAELLDQLGWSPQDAAEFVRRWKELKQSAEDPSPKGKTAQKQLNEILKSLGLKPKSNTIQGNRQHQDELRGMDPGRDVPPPPQWSEYFQAYLKSLGATP